MEGIQVKGGGEGDSIGHKTSRPPYVTEFHQSSGRVYMKCRKHLGDLSSAIGVCASCLRERLFVLIAAQAMDKAYAEIDHDDKDCQDHDVRQLPDARQSLPPIPKPQLIPNSVSPRHWKSSSSCDPPIHRSHSHRRRFFSTPQVGPTFSNNPVYDPSEFLTEKKASRFSLLGFIFRNRSEKIRDTVPPNPDPTSQPSPSSSIFGLWKKKQWRASSVTNSGVSGSACRRKCTTVSNRGMSPVGASDDEEDRDGDRSPFGSGYSSDGCPHSWKRTPAPLTASTTARRTTTTPHPRNLPGFAFFLNPMVRASPSRNRRNKGCKPAEVGFSGDIRVVPAKGRRNSDEASFCKNRSRKLADFGRGADHR